MVALELDNERDPPPPLEEKSNVVASRKPRNREVSSRYKSAGSAAAGAVAAPPPQPPPPPTIRRFPSPNFFVAAAAAPLDPLPKRAISAERKRGGGGGEKIDHALKPAANRQRAGAATPERKRIVRQSVGLGGGGGGDQAENARPIENVGGGGGGGGGKLGWPGRSVSRSVDLSSVRASSVGTKGNRCLVPTKSFNQAKKVAPPGHDGRHDDRKVAAAAETENCFPGDGSKIETDSRCVRSVPDEADLASSCDYSDKSSSRTSLESSAMEDGSSEEKISVCPIDKSSSSSDLRSLDKTSSDPIDIDKISISSSSSSISLQRSSLETDKGSSRPIKGARGTVVPARFWQDLGSRIRRLSDVNQLRASMPEGEFLGSKTAGRRSNKPGGGNSAPSSAGNTPAPNQAPPSWIYSPVRTVPAAPPPHPPPPPSPPSTVTKSSSPSRALPSPTRSRAVPGSGLYQGARSGSVACMLNFGSSESFLTGRKAMSQQEEALFLRILHNRLLQWRFVNARSQSTMIAQKATGERMLYNASLQISDLQNRVAEKRIKLQKAKQESKLRSMIACHGEHLEEWAELEPDHTVSLSGVIAALEAATLKVPVTCGAKVDIPALQNALTLVSDAMAPLESTTRELLPRVEKANETVCQLAQVSSQGKALLQECGELLDRIATLEIEERSLRSYVVQLDNEKKRATTTTSRN